MGYSTSLTDNSVLTSQQSAKQITFCPKGFSIRSELYVIRDLYFTNNKENAGFQNPRRSQTT